MAKKFGFGKPTGSDIPGRGHRSHCRPGVEARLLEVDEAVLLQGRQGATGNDFLHRFAREFCVEGFADPAGDAVNFAIGQGDTAVTPLQLARAYAALANGGTLFEPRVAKALVSPEGRVLKRFAPEGAGEAAGEEEHPRLHRQRAEAGGHRRHHGLAASRGFPLDKVTIRAKTGSAEVYGKQTTSWVASYTKDYVVLMTVSQGGTGSGTSGPFIRKIWEHLYGIRGTSVHPSKAAIPGTKPPAVLPTFARDGSILPPPSREVAATDDGHPVGQPDSR